MARWTWLLASLAWTVSLAQAADVVLIRKVQTAESQWDPQSAIDRYVAEMRDHLTSLGIETDTLDDLKATGENLRPYALALLPHQPGVPPSLTTALTEYVGQGGKIGLFYMSDGPLLNLVGLSGASYLGGDQLGSVGGVTFDRTVLPGAPTELKQRSWNLNRPTLAVQAPAVSAGEWVDATGQPKGLTALTVHDHGFFFGHVLAGHDPAGEEQMLLALVGRYVADMWPKAAASRLARIGKIGPFADYDALAGALADAPAAARLRLTAAATSRREAQQRLEQGRPAEAFDLAGQGIAQAQEAYLASRKPRERELRAVWIHQPWGIADWGWDKTIKVLADNGFNAIFPNMLWGGVADYPSEVLPVHPEVATRGDQIALCLAACRKYGVELHVWKVNWNMGGHTPATVKEQMQAAGRCQRSRTGAPSDYLAPHLQENFELERDAMLEIVRKYEVDGIHFDYIRYPDQNHDFSDSARAAFEQQRGKPVEGWPESCYQGPLTDEWNAWRRGNITRLVEAVYDGAHAIRPEIQVSAAVFSDWDGSPHSVAQATEEWLDQGWLDFVCPMDYTPDHGVLTRWLNRQAPAVAGRVPLYAGLGSFRHESPAETAYQIDLTRQLGADGFVCFDLSERFASGWLPALRTGSTSAEAGLLPHHSPALAGDSSPGIAGLGVTRYRLGKPIELTLHSAEPDRMDGLASGSYTILRDGAPVGEPQALAIREGRATVGFTPDQPGVWRVEVAGEYWVARVKKQSPVFWRSAPLVVVDNATAEDLLTRLGPPRFAGHGGLKVAVWHDAYGAATMLPALAAAGGLDVAPLYNFDPASLRAAQVVILPQPRRDTNLFRTPATVKAVREYLQGGGAVLVTHALVGLRGLVPYGPEVATGVETVGGRGWQAVGDHPATQGLVAGTVYQSTFGDRISIAPQPGATVIATTDQGVPIAAVGAVGRGRYAAVGLGLAIGGNDADAAPSEAELTLLANTLRWLAQR